MEINLLPIKTKPKIPFSLILNFMLTVNHAQEPFLTVTGGGSLPSTQRLSRSAPLVPPTRAATERGKTKKECNFNEFFICAKFRMSYCVKRI